MGHSTNARFAPKATELVRRGDPLLCAICVINAVQQISTGLRSCFWVFGQLLALAGRRTVNTEPLPGSLVTVTSPPIMRASLRERARPSPVPP